MKAFSLYRISNVENISGSGRLIDGVIFHTGQVAVCWRTDIEGAKHGHSSIGIYQSWESFEYLHVKAHSEYDTEIKFFELDEEFNRIFNLPNSNQDK